MFRSWTVLNTRSCPFAAYFSIVELCEPKVCAKRLRFILEHALEVNILHRVSQNLLFDLNVKALKKLALPWLRCRKATL